jgi:hypothetical protein
MHGPTCLGHLTARPGTGRHYPNLVAFLFEISSQLDDLAITSRVREEVFVTEY